MPIRTLSTYLFLSFALCSAPAVAQTVTPTLGAISLEWDGSLTGFRLAAPNTQLNGEVLQSPSHTFVAGTRADLNEVINTTNQSNHPFAEEINGVMYNVWVKAQFTFTTQPMAIPFADDGTRATFSTPFTVTGQFSGYSDQALTNQVFSVSVQGSGVASAVDLRYDAPTQIWDFAGSGGEVFTFTGPLPSQWSATDVGTVGVRGVSSFSNNIYDVAGGGADIWGTADAFQFVSQPFTTDGSIVARVTNEQTTSAYAKAGVMIRQTGSSSAADVILDARPGGIIEFMTRPSAGGSTIFLASTTVTAAPWLKLSRAGSTVTASISTDGSAWTTLGTTTLAGSALIGLAVTSHDTTILNQASFDNVVVSTTSTGGGSLPIGWEHGDVGAVGIAGNATYVGGQFTVSGAGADVWGTADAFHYAYTPHNSDGYIAARIVSMDNTNTYAKAGVMFRDSLNADAVSAILDVRPNGWVEFMTRSATGGSTTYITGVQASFPVFLKLQRKSGSTFVAFVLDSSGTWQQIGSVDNIPMAPNATAGLAVTSHDTTALNTASFDTVEVVKNLLVESGFEGYSVPSLGPPGWISDNPLRPIPAQSETAQPHSGSQNGVCSQTTFEDCGIYQEVTAPEDGVYVFTIFANASHSGAFVGVNADGGNAIVAPVDVHAFGVYEEYTMFFHANAGSLLRVWMYSPPSPGDVVIDDAVLERAYTSP